MCCLHFKVFSHYFRFPAWSRRGWHYARDTQRALFCTRRNSNRSWRTWTTAKVRPQSTLLSCVYYRFVWSLIYSTPTLLTESSALSNTSFPHIIPVLSLLERGMAVGDVLEPWESAEVGVDVVMYHLEAARTIAHHGGIYRTNAETKLQGKDDLWKRDRSQHLCCFQPCCRVYVWECLVSNSLLICWYLGCSPLPLTGVLAWL